MTDLGVRPAEGAKKSWWRSGWSVALLSALIGVLIGAVAVAASSGYFVRRTLVANPEIVQEAIEALQAREMANIVEPRRAALETPFHGAWAGAREPDVVLVEFFDYACGYCRASNPHVDRLLREDPKLRVVWREFPVLGPDSEAAAVASLAAARAGRYRPFFDALFASGRPTAPAVAAARQAVGIAEAALDDEARGELQKNFDLARAIGAQGTPTFVVGDQVLQGAVGYEALRDAVAEAREANAG
ncbi:MAG TPA: DsbA family protein [Allosphingosinicella sp.]|nr:DsbA family protein [Allosphingosinicella sp.]